MSKKIRVSVVTVCYNAVNEIENTILSVVDNSNSDIEYIVIDGGSSDGTLDIIKKYSKFITYWVSEKDDGVYDAMNKGMKHATGEYIININAGDRLINIPFDILKDELNNDTVAVCGYIVSENNHIFRPIFNWKMRLQNQMPHQGLFYKLNDLPLYDTRWKIVGDYDLNLKLYLNHKKVRIIDYKVAFHSLIGLSNTQKSAKESLKVIEVRCGRFFRYVSWIYRKCKAVKAKLNGLYILR